VTLVEGLRTIELGVTITDAAVDEKVTTIVCVPVARDPRCPDCGRDGRYRDTVTRPLTDLPIAGYPLVLRVAVPRFRCTTVECGRAVLNQDLGKLAAPRASTTRRCARYVLRRLMIDRTTIAAIAAELGVSWHTVSAIAMHATAGLLTAAGPDRLAVVRVIGVDEHRWAPRRVGPDGFVTLIIDLTPTQDGTGPARLLDMVAGRSASALASWLAAQPAAFAAGVEAVAMDGFAGYKTAAAQAVPDAVTVMDPFHVVALAGVKLDLVNGSDPARPATPRSSSACPPANCSAAAALRAATPASLWAEPRCSIERHPRRDDHTICTAVAPELVFTARIYATSAPYEATANAQIGTSRTNPHVTALQSRRIPHSAISQISGNPTVRGCTKLGCEP
jgi:hypothetical protein